MTFMNNIARACLAALLVAGVAKSSAASPDAPASVDWSAGTVVTISMSNFAFDPDPLVLQSGKPYRLHFVNDSTSSHNFKAPEFFGAAAVAPGAQAKIEDGAVAVKEKASVDVDLVPTTAGKYPVECTHFMHAMMGMTSSIVVQ
jgi:plastocyanin